VPASFTVADSAEGRRLDHLVASHLGCSHQAARRLIAEGAVRVAGRRARKGDRVHAGDRIEITKAAPTAETLRPVAEIGPLEVLYRDEALLALAKPEGVPLHPLREGERGTLASALLAEYPECAEVADDPREAGFVHRLDIDTSGIVLAARTRAAWVALRRTFSSGETEKSYLALVAGRPPDAGLIEAPISHAPDARRATVDQGRGRALAARTRFRVLAAGHEVALVEAVTSTGRMHQIRVHLAYLGHPLVGDELYGGPLVPTLRGHFLHAARVTFAHPFDGRRLILEAPLPPSRTAALVALLGRDPFAR
jgi:23S rRNA pseudouridine1911/1915/1917 synthase